ncbi:hypothetical protein P154DRAFT_623087 [Amniculicola lignicola CBS 123094]|uniref:Mediator of RNA polymerase II transcription subunit 21 n=1 Tax=Amniculicola lignicola CBS 123094 TaxID=1392246 RepID=A0A6A5W415_9PLEO|nr:hypothetical protein P154DRAFT_623087 [Amniculicola lignicola CBS 123094]
MADILTQIQDELDMLLHQMSAALSYIKNAAPPSPIPGQPTQSSFAEYEAQTRAQEQPSTTGNTQTQTQTQTQHSLTQHTSSTQTQTQSQSQTQSQTQTQAPTQTTSQTLTLAHTQTQTTPPAFPPSIKELSYDLIMKEQQIEHLIARLPGIGTSEQEQGVRMRVLEQELDRIEGERRDAVREKEGLVGRVEEGLGVVGGCGGGGGGW